MSAPRRIPAELQDQLDGLMGQTAAEAWWTTPDYEWCFGLAPESLYSDRPQLVCEIITAALTGAIPLEGH